MVWTREEERRARAHGICAQPDSRSGKVERNTTVKIHRDMRANGIEEKEVQDWGTWQGTINVNNNNNNNFFQMKLVPG